MNTTLFFRQSILLGEGEKRKVFQLGPNSEFSFSDNSEQDESQRLGDDNLAKSNVAEWESDIDGAVFSPTKKELEGLSTKVSLENNDNNYIDSPYEMYAEGYTALNNPQITSTTEQKITPFDKGIIEDIRVQFKAPDTQTVETKIKEGGGWKRKYDALVAAKQNTSLAQPNTNITNEALNPTDTYYSYETGNVISPSQQDIEAASKHNIPLDEMQNAPLAQIDFNNPTQDVFEKAQELDSSLAQMKLPQFKGYLAGSAPLQSLYTRAFNEVNTVDQPALAEAAETPVNRVDEIYDVYIGNATRTTQKTMDKMRTELKNIDDNTLTDAQRVKRDQVIAWTDKDWVKINKGDGDKSQEGTGQANGAAKPEESIGQANGAAKPEESIGQANGAAKPEESIGQANGAAKPEESTGQASGAVKPEEGTGQASEETKEIPTDVQEKIDEIKKWTLRIPALDNGDFEKSNSNGQDVYLARFEIDGRSMGLHILANGEVMLNGSHIQPEREFSRIKPKIEKLLERATPITELRQLKGLFNESLLEKIATQSGKLTLEKRGNRLVIKFPNDFGEIELPLNSSRPSDQAELNAWVEQIKEEHLEAEKAKITPTTEQIKATEIRAKEITTFLSSLPKVSVKENKFLSSDHFTSASNGVDNYKYNIIVTVGEKTLDIYLDTNHNTNYGYIKFPNMQDAHKYNNTTWFNEANYKEFIQSAVDSISTKID